ncbi:hypothetical protein E4U13_004906 [Claviceps humidiphila]|uniref:Uncharacterized protein n=1 Tax=Claviceps humidiphila TaxID=1294629 RepID=A0A9P7PYI2_9HYPO|nr:hypothetical protein E4U13_004906 [Claviceps humidiphila]
MSLPTETDAIFSILPVSPIPPFSLSTQLLPSCSDDFSYSQTFTDTASQTYTESEAPTTIGHITGSAPPPTGTASDTSAASYTSSGAGSTTVSTTVFTSASTTGTGTATGTATASQTSTAGAAAVAPPAFGHYVAGLGVMALAGLGMGVAI